MKVIGICGPSCSGKSSIAKELAKIISCNVISNDHFYKLGSPKKYVEHEGKQIRTYERPEFYDGKAVAKIIKDLKENKTAIIERLEHEGSKELIKEEIKQKEYLIVEGFHILNYEELLQEIETSFFIQLSFEEIIKRRRERNIQRNNNGNKDEEFILIGEKEWEQYGQPQIKKAKHILDGNKPVSELAQEVLDRIKTKLLDN